MRYIAKILKYFSVFFEPVRRNGRFFVFMYLLGLLVNYAEKPQWKGAKIYDNLWLELFLDVYVVCALLAVLPQRLRRWVRGVLALLAFALSLADVFCWVRFKSALNPTMLLLLGETNGREASEFVGAYLSPDILLTSVGLVLLLAVAYVACGKWQKLRGANLVAQGSGLVAGRAVCGVACAALLGWSLSASWRNKAEMAEMFGKQTIGQVEHELTTQKHAEFYLPAYRLAFSIFSNRLAAQQIDRCLVAKNHVEVDSCSFRSENIVLIIGESYNKYHAQLYGYDKETTPRQVRRKQTDRLVAFSDVVAPWNLTSFVFKNVFSLHVVGQEGDWCDYPLFPEVFRKAGYRVSFITNQFLPKAKEEVYDFSGGFFLNNPELSAAQFDERNVRLHVLDEGLLHDLDKMLQRQKGASDSLHHNLLIFHVMGQHVRYNSRYSGKQRRWWGKDYDRPDLSVRNRDILSHYDNATLYNDSIVDEVIKRFEDEDAIVVYMPDHGEECYNDGFKHHGRNHSADISPFLAHQEFDIPFWIWCSHRYAVTHPDIYQQVIEAKDRRMMTDALPHLLLYLAGIGTKDYHAEYNVLSPQYDEMRPRVIKGQVDYDRVVAK